MGQGVGARRERITPGSVHESGVTSGQKNGSLERPTKFLAAKQRSAADGEIRTNGVGGGPSRKAGQGKEKKKNRGYESSEKSAAMPGFRTLAGAGRRKKLSQLR